MTRQKHSAEINDTDRFGLSHGSRIQLETFRREHETQVLTILLSDIEDSTRLQSGKGNIRAAELVKAHRSLFRGVLEDRDGLEVETAGDSFLVVFAAPSEAVKFALHLQAAMRQAALDLEDFPRIRIGIHQGQVVVEYHEEGRKPLDVYGLQISTAARIMDLAQGGQILCSRPVFDDARAILRAEDFAGLGPIGWRNHGPFRFKGVDDTHEVCEAGEKDKAPLRAPARTSKGWPADSAEEELGWRPASGINVPGTNWILEERLGQRSGDHRIPRNYGGYFGEVWKAWNPASKSHEVFKFCFRKDRVPKLKREARLLKRLRHYRHPNIVDVYDVTEGDRPPYYLEMEYVPGPDMESWIETSPPLEERLEIIAQVADALDTVHAAGIFHRDIKPSNILLTRREDGRIQAKLTDFGLGAAEDPELLGSLSETRVEGIAGTWDYIAPELRAGHRATARSDLYSLGVTLFQIAVGDFCRPLWDWEKQVENEILKEDILRCVVTEPEQRWNSAGDLARALRSSGERLRRRQLERERETHKLRSRRLRFISGLTAFIAALMILLGGLALFQWRRALEHRDRSEQQKVEARHQLGTALLERSRMLENEARSQSLLLTAGRATGFEAFGGPFEGYPALLKKGTLEYAEAFGQTLSHDIRLLWQSPNCGYHSETLLTLAFSPDGRFLASAGLHDGTIRLWDVATGAPAAALTGHSEGVSEVCFSPDGRILASAGYDDKVCLWEVPSGRLIDILMGHTNTVTCLEFSPDGTALASGSDDQEIRIWDTSTHESKTVLQGHTRGISSLDFAPDGKTLASAGWDGTLQIWDCLTGKGLFKPVKQSFVTRSLSFFPDGKHLAAGDQDGMLRIWSTEDAAMISALQGHTRFVTSLSLSRDGKILASGSNDRTVRVWDAEKRQPKATLEGHRGGVNAVALSPDGQVIASADENYTILLWDAVSGKMLTRINGHSRSVWGVAFSRDGKTLASSSTDSTIRLWDTKTGRTAGLLSGHFGSIRQIAFSPDGRILASAGFDHTIRLWDMNTNTAVGSLTGHQDPIGCLSFSPEGQFLASGGDDKTITIWDLPTRKPLRTLRGHRGWVQSTAFGPDGSLLASGDSEGVLKIWDARTGRLKADLRGHDSGISCLVFSPDGRILVSGGMYDGKILIWDVAGHAATELKHDLGLFIRCLDFDPSGTRLAAGDGSGLIHIYDPVSHRKREILEGHSGSVSSVCFSPDGLTLASGSSDNTVCMWDMGSQPQITEMAGHSHFIRNVAFSPLGGTAASASDTKIYLWDVDNHKAIAALEGHEGPIISLLFSRDGRNLVSGSHDKKLIFWDLASLKPATILEEDDWDITCLGLGPEGLRLAAGGAYGIRIWDMRTKEKIKVLSSGKGSVLALDFSPNGKSLASGDFDDTVIIWDLESGEAVHTLLGHSSFITTVRFSPDGKILASGSDDKTIRLWDATSGRRLHVIEGHLRGVSSIRFTSDGETLISSGWDGSLRMWDTKSSSPKAVVRLNEDGLSSMDIAPGDAILIAGSPDKFVRLWRTSSRLVMKPDYFTRFHFKGLEVEFVRPEPNLYLSPGYHWSSSFRWREGR